MNFFFNVQQKKMEKKTLDVKKLFKEQKSLLVEKARNSGRDFDQSVYGKTKELLVAFLSGKEKEIAHVAASCNSRELLDKAYEHYLPDDFAAIKKLQTEKGKDVSLNKLCARFIEKILIADIDLSSIYTFFPKKEYKKEELLELSVQTLTRIVNQTHPTEVDLPHDRYELIAYILGETACYRHIKEVLYSKEKCLQTLEEVITSIFKTDPADVSKHRTFKSYLKWILKNSLGNCDHISKQIDDLFASQKVDIDAIIKAMNTLKTTDKNQITRDIGSPLDDESITGAIEQIKKIQSANLDLVLNDPQKVLEMGGLKKRDLRAIFFALPLDEVIAKYTERYTSLIQEMVKTFMEENPANRQQNVIVESFITKYPNVAVAKSKVKAVVTELLKEVSIDAVVSALKTWMMRHRSVQEEKISKRVSKYYPTIDVQEVIIALKKSLHDDVLSYAKTHFKEIGKSELSAIYDAFPYLKKGHIKDILKDFDHDEGDGSMSPFHVETILEPPNPDELDKIIRKVFSVYDVNPELLPKTWVEVSTKN